MKKLLLAGTVIAGFASVATPALAEGLSLDLGGFYRGYGVFSDVDETGAASNRDFNFRQKAEIHFTGETTLDNGLTVGVHSEMNLTDTAGVGAGDLDEIYAYFSGSWGRVNFGNEDGAAYLLQVAAPSADSNIDGLRAYVDSFTDTTGTTSNFSGFVAGGSSFDYDNAAFNDAQKLTYITPKFSGFQAAVSYTPEVSDSNTNFGNAKAAVTADNNIGDLEDGIEISARWDGEYEGVGISVGAGYLTASTEVAAATGVVGSDDLQTWDVGLTVDFSGFSVGGAYVTSNNAVDNNADSDIWVLGAAWDNGPYHLGATWYASDIEEGAVASDTEFERFTFGGAYSYGPGMSFRGSVAFGDVDVDVANLGGRDQDFTQVAFGTDIKF